jgi:hypothetical protein
MAQLIENTLMNKGIIQNAIPVVKGLIISDLQTQLIAELQETIKATVTYCSRSSTLSSHDLISFL